MRKIILFLLGWTAVLNSAAQNPATVFTIANRTIILPCGTTCTSISAQVPHIKQSTDYVITNPAYVPFAYTTTTGDEVTSVYTDDKFSPLIDIPFNFCFYGNFYNSLVMGSNAILTFDASNANKANAWPLTTTASGGTPVPIPYAGGTQDNASSTYYPATCIMGPYHDIYPTLDANGQRKIEWRVEGTAPRRRFIGSYYSVPMFSCTTTNATSQIVIYEGTGIIEVYVHDKPVCTSWNSGLAILGIQNGTRDRAVAAPGKNATVWGTTGMDSCFRFIPSAGIPRLKSAQLVVNGTVVALADTSTLSPGVLNLNFPNLCPTADSTAYVLRVTYNDCIGFPATDIIFTDTVFVKKGFPPSLAAVVKTDANCTTGGSITVTGSGSITPYEYSINNGSTWQASNVFPGLAAGTYDVRIRTVGASCLSAAQAVTIAATNNLTMSPVTGGTICSGASFTPVVTSNATGYSWTPTTGVSNPAIKNPVLTPTSTTTYTVTGTLGTCTIQQTVTVTVNAVTINPITAGTICAGASFTPSVTGNATSYSWTPTTGVSNPAIANPVLTPTSTTTYTVTGTLGTCTTQQTVTVTVNTITMSPITGGTICPGASFTPSVTSNATGYSWTPTTGVSNPAIANPVLTPASTTTYTVTGTLGTCTTQQTVTVTVSPAPTVNAGPDATIFLGGTYQMQGNGAAGTYLWTPSIGLSATNILNPNANPISTTTYTLRVTNAQGCFATDDVTITVATANCVKPMEAFTPNGDGINDLWLITNGNCITSATAQVFNRYGAKVFESNDYKNTWNGTYKGKPLPDGTYYFIITYRLLNGKLELLKGNVTILR
ncbi:MAG: gliding motility-associated C-terminal domain-containing protein [Bacteroidota bacterium]